MGEVHPVGAPCLGDKGRFITPWSWVKRGCNELDPYGTQLFNIHYHAHLSCKVHNRAHKKTPASQGSGKIAHPPHLANWHIIVNPPELAPFLRHCKWVAGLHRAVSLHLS